MKKKPLLLAVCSCFFATSIFADGHLNMEHNYKFVKTDNSPSTQICYTIVTGNKSQLRNKVNEITRNTHQARRVMKTLECNDMSTVAWADKYASPDMKKYIVARYYKNKIPQGKVTIKDL